LTLAHADTWVLRVVPYRSIRDWFARREYVGEEIDLGKVKVRKLRFQRHFVYFVLYAITITKLSYRRNAG
jgi:hypothetical protein